MLFLILKIREAATNKGMTGSRWWLKRVQCLLCLPHYQWDFLHPSSILELLSNLWSQKSRCASIWKPKRVFGVQWVSPGKKLGSCAVGTGNVFGNNPWDQVRGKQKVMIWKEPCSTSRSLVGRGNWVRKRTEDKGLSDSFIYFYLFNKNMVKVG